MPYADIERRRQVNPRPKFARLALTEAELTDIIPSELREHKQWVLWRLSFRNNKWTKIPLQASGDLYGVNGRGKRSRRLYNAKSTDPTTWSDFHTAVRVHHDPITNNSSGIGFVFAPDDGLAGIDLDHCIDETGTVAPWAEEIMRRFPSYAEKSPSGTGLHIIVKTRNAVRHSGKRPDYPVKGCAVEIYDRGRYFCTTGDVLPGMSELIDCTDTLAAWNDELFPEKPRRSRATPSFNQQGGIGAGVSLDVSDIDLLRMAQRAKNGARFSALWEGTVDTHGSQSEADFALASMLAFYTGNDPERIERLMRKSGLVRAKWDRADYLTRTIERALNGRTDFYKPHSGGARVSALPMHTTADSAPSRICRVSREWLQSWEREWGRCS